MKGIIVIWTYEFWWVWIKIEKKNEVFNLIFIFKNKAGRNKEMEMYLGFWLGKFNCYLDNI